MVSSLDILNPKISDPHSPSLKEGIAVPSNCSVVKKTRKRKRNDKRTGWQFKRPEVRAKIDFWNEAQKRQARSRAIGREQERIRNFCRFSKPSHVFTRHPDGTVKNDYGRYVSVEGQEGQRQSGIRRARENAQKRKSPTTGLSGLKPYENGSFRSLAEAETAAFLSISGLNPQYAETSAAQAAKSVTINLQPTFRQDDFHVDVGTKKYKIQVKGPASLFKRFEKLIGPMGTEKQFRHYRSDLLNLINEDVINQLQLSLSLPVREQLLLSTTSLRSWIRHYSAEHTELPKPESVLPLLKRESNRFRRHLYQFAEAIFAKELQVIDRAVELFLSVPKEELTEVPALVIDFYIECLACAMDDLGYDNHIRSIHRGLYRWRKNANQLRSLLPRRFEPTKP